YGPLAGSWRGKKPIQRNAMIALGNYKEKESSDRLGKLLQEDPRPVIRETAAWALGEIGTEEAENMLKKAVEYESESNVRTEIQQAIKRIKEQKEENECLH